MIFCLCTLALTGNLNPRLSHRNCGRGRVADHCYIATGSSFGNFIMIDFLEILLPISPGHRTVPLQVLLRQPNCLDEAQREGDSETR